MDRLTPSLSLLVAIDAGCFRAEVFEMFRLMLGGWICCLGRRTIRRVWETTGLPQTQDLPGNLCPCVIAAVWKVAAECIIRREVESKV